MNQTYQTLIAIAIVVGAFFLGRSTTPIPDAEVRIEVDSTLIDSIPKLIEESDRYKLLYFKSQEDNNRLKQSYDGAIVRVASLQDGISNLRDSVSKIEPTIFIDSTNNIALNIPMQDYHFEGENYKFGVNAYNATLLYGDVQSKTIYETKVVKVNNRWGVGVQVGYGICGSQLSPYVGVGLSYNIFTW